MKKYHKPKCHAQRFGKTPEEKIALMNAKNKYKQHLRKNNKKEELEVFLPSIVDIRTGVQPTQAEKKSRRLGFIPRASA